MHIDEVRRVLVIGAGTMGRQIAFQCATHGYLVALYDVQPAALDAATRWARSRVDDLYSARSIGSGERKQALAALTMTSDPAAAAVDVDLAIESVPEDPELKRQVFAQFGALCSPRAVFATNTSTLIPSMFAAASGRPDRLAALHFHTPVWPTNIVDVMPHADTLPETVELLFAFARRIGQIPIRLRTETHRYIFNAVYEGMNREAISLVANGIASIEDVDRAWMGVMKMGIGPFGMLDGVGLDTLWQILDYWARQLDNPQLQANADFVRAYVDRGCLGVKTGEGFYRYPNPAFAAPGFLQSGSNS